MAQFPLHDETTAPEAARPHLASAKRRMGFITTLNAVMAESPELLAGYNALAEQFGKSSLPTPAKHVVWITASVENDCAYCVAAHSTMALRSGLPQETVDALREAKPLPDTALEAARRLTRSMVTNRGWVSDEEVDAFLAAGYTERHVLDIVLGVGMKTLSNYTNHVAHTPLDPAWESQEWTKA
ncbi:carboxymuconolactone decarboxylase family protein [Kitasatospora atroaurantiaca]|uniref:AhpD family alkylhydroperoxidase n=1 Tax=Kitasatospora atroaurantiaca TaxID=285545 RepID=A0A561F0I0_9ACTN|nr:carboxymuconolactone decarboxylase family protein [Kitasatospora atroaurantiaca]TWE21369.1 AhpD family alkylhydroperoxidase [Kitasatospora atroaurantiaca]